MSNPELDQLEKKLVTSMVASVQAVLALDDKIPDSITDTAIILAMIPGCPFCNQKVTIAETQEQLPEFMQKLHDEVCRLCVPDRWHAVLQGMHAHLERCDKE